MTFRSLSNHKVVPALFIVFALGSISSLAQEKELPEPLKSKPQYGFSEYLQSLVLKEFNESRELPELNYNGLVGIAPIPPSQSPVKNRNELESGKTIGALFLSTGSQRLKLPPGIFRVFVLKKNDRWIVQFFDASDHPMGEAPATVTEAPKVSLPFVSIDHSVCVSLMRR
jgi:hypothetical protein